MKTGTIYALASGGAPAGVAVIRMSGNGASEAVRALGVRDPLTTRVLHRVTLRHPESGEALDDALAVLFSRPRSFTGEDVVEFHVHGGRAVVAGVLDALGGMEGLRLAEPGEFTRRAFENNKMDLTAAEGLADLVAAETAAQRRQALHQMGGGLRDLYDGWRQRLVGSLAHLEATIDFSDEELPANLMDDVRREVGGVAREVAAHLADDGRGERLRGGVHVAIVGPPNAGKSSLLNLLARRDAAIVSETAGTTRDVIEVRLDLGGYPVIVADTAGLREGGDAIESEGVRRATKRAVEADIRLVVFDATVWPECDARALDLIDGESVVVLNKVDVARPEGPPMIAGRTALGVSALSGEGINRLEGVLSKAVVDRFPATGAPAMTRARHREALGECAAALDRFLEGGGKGSSSSELMAEDLRLATRALGRITGGVDVEDLLDVIFRDFCIGK
ncbi:MAG: tRNA uridine-5-carboxymethylaminomethyl(34) synthesis GTPase MnmE [Rhodospirillales bacterium]|jgi:tRNA modification GTPase|nr:tRNA uridine-5-carboxymethylaminomethyl(34) synthesis GTPase MnmE [Rhodospirillales bacterium]